MTVVAEAGSLAGQQAAQKAAEDRRAHFEYCRAQYETCRAEAEGRRILALAVEQVAGAFRSWAETFARLWQAGDQMDGNLRRAGVRDPETFGDVAEIQAQSLGLAQFGIGARDRAQARVSALVDEAHAWDGEARSWQAQMLACGG